MRRISSIAYVASNKKLFRMLKKTFSPLTIHDLALIVVSSIMLTIFYNFKTLESGFSTLLLDFSVLNLLQFLLGIVAIFLVTALLLVIFSFNKIALKTLLILFCVVSTIYFYVLNKFGTILDAAMIANALESLGHADEVIDFSLVGYFIFFAFLPALVILRLKIVASKKSHKLMFVAVASIICLATHLLFAAQKTLKIAFTQYSPVNYSTAIYEYFERFHAQLDQGKQRISLSEIYKFERAKSLENFNVILIVGESLRADHLGLNGYQKDTTPLLAQQKNFLNFVVESNFNTTTRAVTSMMSHRNKSEFVDVLPEKTLISVFKELGFKTYWYSAQSSKEFHNGMINMMAAEANEYFFRDRLQSANHSYQTYDEALIEPLKKVLQNGGNNFVVLHSFGNHIRFHERYPRQFAKYLPECEKLPDSCPKQDVNNSYDNSVLYMDYFVSQVIKSLQNTNSLLIFAADHGVFLGENGVFANGSADAQNDAVKKVPMFFYMTDELMKQKYFRQKFVTASHKMGMTNLSHDNVFDSVLNCAAIDSDLFQRKQSICQ